MARSNPEYFGFLMERYNEKLTFFIRRISFFQKEDIEDILQEVFIKVYKNLNEYDDSLKFSSWIYRITRNQTIDNIRKKSRHNQNLSLEEHDFEKFLKSSVNLEKKYAEKETMEKTREAIMTLPLKYREVMVLKFLEEKNYDEMIDILKKPKGTIATLISRGKTLLQENLTNLY